MNLGNVVFLACFGVALVLTVVGTPMDIFKANNGGSGCITLWGVKNDCTQSDYTTRVNDLPICDNAKSRLRAGEAFALISIGLEVIGIIVALLGELASIGLMRWVAGGVGILTTGSLLITWGVVAAFWNQSVCDGVPAYKDLNTWNYGSAFGLFVTSFCVVIIGTVIVFVLKPEEKPSQ